MRLSRWSSAPSANACCRSSRAGAPTSSPDRIASTSFIEIIPAPGHSAGHVVFKLESGGAQAVFIGDVFHHLLQVYYPHWNFPKNSDADEARASRRKVLEHCAASGALVLPGHVGAPFAGHIEATADGYRPDFKA